jgi:hypothetical protein
MAQIVQRPAMYFAMLALAAACGLAGIVSMPLLSARLLAGPQVIAVNKADLQAALEDSPWFALEDPGLPLDADMPKVWLLSELHCPTCQQVEAKAKALETKVAVLITSPRGVDRGTQRALAEISRRRSAQVLQDWRARPDRPLPVLAGVQDVDLGPAALAGYAEWSHASFDRLAEVAAANGSVLKAPALFWRRGREWRMAANPGEEAFRAVRQDIKAGG